MRRLLRVLKVVLQPIRPGSDLVGALQIVASLALPVLAGLFPFLFRWEWTWANAALVAMVIIAVLSLRGAYQLQTDNEVLLGQTHLQKIITDYIQEGVGLLKRLERKKKAEQVPRPLTDQIISWAGRMIRDLESAAPDVAADVYEAHGTGLDTRAPKDQMRYVRDVLKSLKKIGRELHGSD